MEGKLLSDATMTQSSMSLTSLLAALALLLSTASISAEVVLPIRIRTFAVNMGNNFTGANGILQIVIDQWSTAQERAALLQTVPKGQDDLLKAVQKSPVKGRINIPGWAGPDPQNYRLGWDLHYAWREALPDGGDRIVVATDRQMSFRETANNPRTTDYPFILIQMEIKKDGTGQGMMVPFTQITFDKKKNAMVIENFGVGGVRLNNITVEKK